jgi:hypothetical protein
MKQMLLSVERSNQWLGDHKFFTAFPVFPFAMFGGILMQKVADRYAPAGSIDRGTMERISGVALDFVVVTAITVMSFDGLHANLGPFIIVVISTWLWHAFCFFFLARRLLPSYWGERAAAELGQSMGITVGATPCVPPHRGCMALPRSRRRWAKPSSARVARVPLPRPARPARSALPPRRCQFFSTCCAQPSSHTSPLHPHAYPKDAALF